MKSMKPFILAALLWLCAGWAAAQAPGLTVVGPGGQAQAFTGEALAALPRETVAAQDHGKPVVFTGSDLHELLRAAGVDLSQPLRGPQMRRVLLVQAADGYAAVFALAELDLTLGDRRVFRVDRAGDNPLAAAEGPWRLVVPKDARGGRWVRQVTRISVIDLP